jgi:nucleoside-diphosphate-sugar epimerase
MARAYFNESLISSVGLRPFVIYGPGREVGGTAGVTLACKAAKQNFEYTVGFSGKVGFVYVEDVTNLVERLIDKAPVGAITMNINGITTSVENFVSIIKKNIPDANVKFSGKPLSVVEEILGGEPSKTFKDFKYTSLDNGINKTINFYLSPES